MPQRNGTGPEGKGSMTGRGQGHCGGAGQDLSAGPGLGCRRGFRGGGSRNARCQDPAQEKAWLTRQAEALEARLAGIRKRLAEDGSAPR